MTSLNFVRYHHTAPISIVYALRKSLNLLAKEGLENVISRHEKNALFLYQQLHDLGLELFVENKVNIKKINFPFYFIKCLFLGSSFTLFNISKSTR